MNKIKQRQIEVHAHWTGLAKPTLVGILHATIKHTTSLKNLEQRRLYV